MRRAQALAFGVTVLLPAAALACPVCARDGGGPGTWALIAAMVAVPYGVAVAAIKLVRHIDRTSNQDQEPRP